MIVVWGPSGDAPLEAVRNVLLRSDIDHVFIDQRLAAVTRVEIDRGPPLGGVVHCGNARLRLEEVTSVYLRAVDGTLLLPVGDELLGGALHAEHLLGSWLNVADALVVNRPAAMASNLSKPFALVRLKRCGFEVPETLITTDPDAAAAFWETHGRVIFKPVGGTRCRVRMLDDTVRHRLLRLRWCPTMFQRFIPGRDVRAHVVGQELRACMLLHRGDSPVDGRYSEDGGQVELQPIELPTEIAARCIRVTAELGLLLAGIDLRVTPQGVWYAFEVNPSPAFTWFLPHSEWVATRLAHLLVV